MNAMTCLMSSHGAVNFGPAPFPLILSHINHPQHTYHGESSAIHPSLSLITRLHAPISYYHQHRISIAFQH